MDTPKLSIVVGVVSDTIGGRTTTAPLTQCLAALQAQRPDATIEILVTAHPLVDGLTQARAAFPDVRWLILDDLATKRDGCNGREHHDEMRARGLAAARGRVVALLEDHEVPADDWIAAVLAEDWTRYGAIGGAIENRVPSALNWAVYFCDFGRYQNPVVDGPSAMASDAHVAYRRDVLERVRDAWHPTFREPAVHAAIRAAGLGLALSPRLVVYQQRRGLTVRTALVERFVWGRSYGAQRATAWSAGRRLAAGAAFPIIWALLLARVVRTAAARPRSRAGLVRALPALPLLVAAWSAGEAIGYWASFAPGTAPPEEEPALGRGRLDPSFGSSPARPTRPS